MNDTVEPPTVIKVPPALHAEPEKTFEYVLMLWFSAFMFTVSGILFIVTSTAQWRGRSGVWTTQALGVASWSSLYIAFAVTLVVYNKWLIVVWHGGFRYPLTITLVHMTLKMILSWTVVRGCRRADTEIPTVSRWTYFLYACPVGAATSLDVAASNASLFYVSVTLHTVIKSTSLVFVLAFSVLYRLQSCSIVLLLVTFVIFGGVLMASYGNSQFDAIGFTLVFVASALSGYRWALTEVLMSHMVGTKMNSLMTMYTISPASVLTLVPFVLWLEWGPLKRSKFYGEPGLFMLAIVNVCGSGLFAFAMIYVELAVLNRTSSLSLVIIGHTKHVAQIIVSVIIFHEVLSPLNVFGVVVTFFGMALYARTKHTSSIIHEARTAPPQEGRKQKSAIEATDTDESRLPFAGGEESDCETDSLTQAAGCSTNGLSEQQRGSERPFVERYEMQEE